MMNGKTSLLSHLFFLSLFFFCFFFCFVCVCLWFRIGVSVCVYGIWKKSKDLRSFLFVENFSLWYFRIVFVIFCFWFLVPIYRESCWVLRPMDDFCVMIQVWFWKKNWFKGLKSCLLFDWVLRGKLILKKVSEKFKMKGQKRATVVAVLLFFFSLIMIYLIIIINK
jgi:hypothetical protein